MSFYRATLEGYDRAKNRLAVDVDWGRGLELDSFQVGNKMLPLSLVFQTGVSADQKLEKMKWIPGIEKSALTGYLKYFTQELSLQVQLSSKVLSEGLLVKLVFEASHPVWIGWEIFGDLVFQDSPQGKVAFFQDTRVICSSLEKNVVKASMQGLNLFKTEKESFGSFEILVSRFN